MLPGRDTVRVDGRAIHPQRPLTLMLHKPPGTVTTLKDPEGNLVQLVQFKEGSAP